MAMLDSPIILALSLIGTVSIYIIFRVFISSPRQSPRFARTANKSSVAQVEKALIQAAIDNSEEATRKLLLENAGFVAFNPEFSCYKKKNRWYCKLVTREHPISYAATLGHSAIVDLLLQAGADIEYRDRRGQTPLVLAAKGNHLQTCRLLVMRGADVQAYGILEPKGVPARTAVSFAWLNKNEELLDLFLQSILDNVGNRSFEYQQAALAAFMCHAAIRNDLDRIQHLISLGADVNNQSSESTTTLLCVSARHADLETVNFVLITGANPNVTVKRRPIPTKGNMTGVTSPLQSAVVNEHHSIEITELLIKNGAVPTREDVEFAQKHGNPGVVEMLEGRYKP